MDRLLLQFVLLGVFSISCSYNIDRQTSHQFETHDPQEYPEEYIENLMAALSDEEREMLRIDNTAVGDRDGDTSRDCSWYPHDAIPKQLPAAERNRNMYYVINVKSYNQTFPVQICDSKNENRCYENATEIVNPGDKRCCFPKEEPLEMLVLSVPVDVFRKNKDAYGTPKVVKKKMYLKTKCSCKNLVPDPQDDGKCNMKSIF